MLRWWGWRAERRRIERELDRGFAQLRGDIARDTRAATARWRELDRLDAEIERKRSELQALESRTQREKGRLDESDRVRSGAAD